MMADDLVAPVSLARELNVKPQEIYSLIKRGKISAYGEKPQKVKRDEVKRALGSVRHHTGGERGKGTLAPRKAVTRRGDIVSWSRGNRQRVGQVFQTEEEALTWIKTQKTPGSPNNTVFMSTDSFRERIIKGEAHVERPLELLQFIGDYYRANELLDAAAVVDDCRSQVFKLVGPDQDEPDPYFTPGLSYLNMTLENWESDMREKGRRDLQDPISEEDEVVTS